MSKHKKKEQKQETEKTYTPSQLVADAQAAVEAQQGSRPGEYQSAWEALLQEAMEQILNRDSFHYNLNGDALYQQYRQQAVRDGRMAMMDTMGQAAAMTGGYGNSYAQTLGQQAYQQSLAQLNDRIPELYAMALEQYRMEGQDQLDRYNLLYGREKGEYDRYQDALNTWQQDANRLWNIYRDQRDYDYGTYRDSVEDAQWLKEFQEAKRRYDQEWEDAHPEVTAAPAVTYTGGTTTKKKTTTTPAPVVKDSYLVML